MVKLPLELLSVLFNCVHWSTGLRSIATVLSSELVYAIWKIRNELVFDHKRKSTIDIENTIPLSRPLAY